MIWDSFIELEDPRKRDVLHPLQNIIVIAICCLIAGGEGWEDMEEFGKSKKDFFSSFLDLSKGIPSHDTFRRVFSLLSPSAFQECFQSWVDSVRIKKGVDCVAVDGKTLRRSHHKSVGKKATHIVSAWSNANKMVLGQLKTEEKSNEITAIPDLLENLYLEGCIVTIDAMGCQTKISETIMERKANYVLSVKDNQPTLHQNIKDFFETSSLVEHNHADMEFYETQDKGHGRIEKREYWMTDNLEWIEASHKWSHLRSIAMVRSTVWKEGRASVEKQYYISSLKPDAKTLAHARRGHWNQENQLHWCLDVTFREDDSRIRTGYAPENMATARHIAFNLLQKETTCKKGIRGKKLKAGWNEKYFKKLLDI